MANIKIVCDASYDDALRLTGYAGGIYLSEKQRTTSTFMYQGVIGELRNIQEGELTAILVGLRELKKRTVLGLVSVDSIEIYTDSKSSELTLLHLNDPTYHDPSEYTDHLFQQIKAMCVENGWQPEIRHVNAHVPIMSASGIERLNQVADERAAYIRRESMRRMITPASTSSKYITVLLPKMARNKEEAVIFRKLAIHLVSQGKRLRVNIEGNTPHHPFVAGIEAYGRAQKIPTHHMARFYSYNPNTPRHGMDMLLYRYHAQQQGRDSRFDLIGSPAEIRAATASCLLFGDSSPEQFHMESPTGRLYATSSAVYDLMDPLDPQNKLRPNSVQGWVNTFLDYVGVPIVQGLNAVLNDVKMDVTHALPPREVNSDIEEGISLTGATTSSDLHHALLNTTKEYKDFLEPHQLAQKMLQVLLQYGKPNIPLFKEGMERFIRVSPKRDLEGFVRRVIRQADKLTPPDPTPHSVLQAEQRGVHESLESSLRLR